VTRENTVSLYLIWERRRWRLWIDVNYEDSVWITVFESEWKKSREPCKPHAILMAPYRTLFPARWFNWQPSGGLLRVLAEWHTRHLSPPIFVRNQSWKRGKLSNISTKYLKLFLKIIIFWIPEDYGFSNSGPKHPRRSQYTIRWAWKFLSIF
jgi:hypothetical protein